MGISNNTGSATEWVLLETLNPIAQASMTTNDLTAFRRYKVVYNLVLSATDELAIRLNEDSGNNYEYIYLSNLTNTCTASTNKCYIGVTNNVFQSVGEVIISGKTPTIAGGRVNITPSGNGSFQVAGQGPVISGDWIGGSAVQITKITIMSAGGAVTFTGTIKIYGSAAI